MILLAVATGMIVYRTAVYVTLYLKDSEIISSSAKTVTTFTAALINLVFILFFSWVRIHSFP